MRGYQKEHLNSLNGFIFFSLKLISIAFHKLRENAQRTNINFDIISEPNKEVLVLFFRFQHLVTFYHNFKKNRRKRNYKGGNVILKNRKNKTQLHVQVK